MSQHPTLAGVTARRERGWLVRWLKEPDRMLAEKDALATALYERYNKVAMPNLRLNEVEIGALLAYLDEQPAPAADARARTRRVSTRTVDPVSRCDRTESAARRTSNTRRRPAGRRLRSALTDAPRARLRASEAIGVLRRPGMSYDYALMSTVPLPVQ